MPLETLLERKCLGGPLDSGLRERMFTTLHARPANLVVGAACGLVTAWTCALLTAVPLLTVLALALTLVTLLRVGLFLWLAQRQPDRMSAWHHDGFALLDLAYAVITGLIAAVALTAPGSGGVAVMASIQALGFGGYIAMRRAARPLLALGLLGGALLPLALAALLSGDPALLVLTLLLPVFGAGMGALVVENFRHLAESMAASDHSSDQLASLQRQARTDALTGLLNRTGFACALEALREALPEGEKLLLARIDLRRFRQVNEDLGHAQGDALLAELARRLTQASPAEAALARFDSDAFVVAARVPDSARASALAASLLGASCRPVRLAGQLAESGARVGAAIYPDHAADTATLLQLAEVALAHARRQGGSAMAVYDRAMTAAVVHAREIEDELRNAIQKDELSIYFQPIVELETGKIRSFEALVRWFHPVKGEQLPADFIPVAEETGLIITLGNWIAAQAARAATAWPADVTLTVNLSPVQIKAPGAALGILSALRTAGLDPARLELDVTEELFGEDDRQIEEFMTAMAQEGVRFVLDDFGTGAGSLHYLSRYPFRAVKVDRSFVSGPHAGRHSLGIIRAVAEMGASLDMDVVAEGIETIEQVRNVRLAGCTLGQGYYFSRPVPDYLAAMLLVQEEDLAGTRLAV